MEAALKRRRWPWIIGAVAACVAAFAVAFSHPLLPRTVGLLVSLATGTHAQFADVRIQRDRIVATGIEVRSRAGPPILSARRVEVRYDLGAWRRRRFGIVSLAVDRPVLRLERLANGNWNVGAVSAGGGAPQRGGVPLWFGVSVQDGTVQLRDPSRPSAGARALDVDRVNLDLRAGAPLTTATFRASAELADRGARFPISGEGSLSYARGDAIQHWHAAELPIADLADFFIASPTVQVAAGTARDLRATVFAVGLQPDSAPSYHLSGTAELRGGALDLSMLAAPVSGVSGRVLLFDGGFLARTLRGDVGGIPIVAHGGLFAITSGRPQLHLALEARSDLRDVRRIFTFAQEQPVAGTVQMSVQLLGTTGDPLIVTRLQAPRAAYGDLPLRDVRGAVTYYQSAVTFDPLLGAYGPIDIALGGTLTLGDHLLTDLALTADAPSVRLPYAAQLAANPRIVGALRLGGTDLTFNGDAFLRGVEGSGSTFAAVRYDPTGLRVEPLHVSEPDGADLWSGAVIGGADHRLKMWGTARAAVVRAPKETVALPGLDLPGIPPLDGRIDARVALEGKLDDLAISGAIGGRDVRVGPLALSSFSGSIAGAGTNVDVFDGQARGPWGTARLSGGYDVAHNVLALRGPYVADLAGAEPLIANTPATGTADGTLSVVVRAARTLVQLTGKAVGRDTVRGVPVSAGFATLGIDDRGVDVYAGAATVAGGAAAAAGRFAPGGALAVTARDVQVAQLRGVGIPLDTGRVLLVGRAMPGQRGPLAFSGGAALVASRVFGENVSGSARFDLDGDHVVVDRGSGAFDGTWAGAEGTIDGVGLRQPSLDLAVDIRAIDVAPWIRRMGYASLYAEGDAAARLHLTGTMADPHVDGTARMNVGSIHGMDFTDLSADFEASRHGGIVRNGNVRVGGSRLAFGARVVDGVSGFSVRGQGIDLADFNDWFDEFAMLAGSGNLDVSASGIGSELSGHADVALDGVRVRSLPFGEVHAALKASRSVVDGSVDLGNAALGTLAVRGSVTLPRGGAESPLAYAERTEAHLRGSLKSFDLTKWLPAVGIEAPLVGAVDADLALDGRYPNARLIGTAQLRNGVVQKLPIDRLALSFNTDFRTTQISDANLELPNVSATGSGTVGPEQRLAFAVHLRSPSVRRLIYDVLQRSVDIDASGEADLHVAGTIAAPALSGGFDLLGGTFGHLPFHEAFGELSLQGRNLVLRDGELRLPHGTISLAGRLPLQLAPLGLGPASSPLGLNLSADGLDLMDLSGFLPSDSTVGGLVDGRLAVSGTLADPLVAGQVTLRDGKLTTPFEREPITDGTVRATLGGHTITVDRLHARVGGGSIDGSGNVEINPASTGATLAYDARMSARRARLDVPAIGQGTLDARLTLAAAAGKVPQLAGNVSLSNTSLSLSGLYAMATRGARPSGASSAPLGLGLDLHVAAGKNVRVQGSVLDIGATGSMDIAGTLADPKLSALFQSTTGTISYFDRVFRVDRATLTFDPQSGSVPFIDATASTRVTTVSPSVAVTLHATGPVTNLNVVFSSSDGSFDRQQLLALLLDVPAFTGQGITPTQGPGAGTPYTQPGGSVPGVKGAPEIPTTPLPPGVLVPSQTGGFDVSAEALSILNAQFGRALLAPLSGVLGLQNLGLALEPGGAVAIDVSKALTDRVSFSYQESFALPARQSMGLDYFPSENTSINLRIFQQGASSLQNQLTSNAANPHIGPGEPLVGSQGWALSIRRLFP